MLALIKNSTELSAAYEGEAAPAIIVNSVQLVSQGGVAGWATTFAGDTYALFDAIYTDTPPDNSQQAGVALRTPAFVGNVAQLVRTWETVTPPVITQISPLEFRARFTGSEQAAILTAALSSAALLGILLEQAAAQYIDLTDPKTISGINALVAAGLLTADRATAILAT